MKIKASLILSLILLLSGFTYASSWDCWDSTKEGAKKAWDLTRTGFARFGNGTMLFYCTLVTTDSCAGSTSWYCPILQKIRPDSCTVNRNNVQEELGENEVDANKKKASMPVEDNNNYYTRLSTATDVQQEL